MGLYEKLGNCHPKLSRGLVWCRSCGRKQKVIAAACIAHGWPKCCGQTMTIDSPEERGEPLPTPTTEAAHE